MALIKIKDTLTPDIRKRAHAAADKKSLLQVMGQAVITLGVQAFTDPAKRSVAWVKRKDDLPHALLQKKTLLRKSIREIAITDESVTIGSDRPYAAIHQFGGKINMPARKTINYFEKDDKNGKKKFSKKGKADHAQKNDVGPYVVTIPARPYLPFNAKGEMTQSGKNRVMNVLKAALKARGL